MFSRSFSKSQAVPRAGTTTKDLFEKHVDTVGVGTDISYQRSMNKLTDLFVRLLVQQ